MGSNVATTTIELNCTINRLRFDNVMQCDTTYKSRVEPFKISVYSTRQR